MTKESIKQSLKHVATDRPFLVLMIGLLLAGLVYAMIVGFSMHPRDVQIYTRYTAFGEAHFYKNPWHYTLLFVVFGLMVATAHSLLMVKLYNLGRRQSGILVAWMGIAVLVIAAVFALSIIRFAFR